MSKKSYAREFFFVVLEMLNRLIYLYTSEIRDVEIYFDRKSIKRKFEMT